MDVAADVEKAERAERAVTALEEVRLSMEDLNEMAQELRDAVKMQTSMKDALMWVALSHIHPELATLLNCCTSMYGLWLICAQLQQYSHQDPDKSIGPRVPWRPFVPFAHAVSM